MAVFAKTVTISSAGATNFTFPDGECIYFRVQNLDGSNNVWVNINGGTAAENDDDCIRVGPGENRYITRLGTAPVVSMLAITGDCDVLVEAMRTLD